VRMPVAVVILMLVDVLVIVVRAFALASCV
jgi:hypothetical protein